MAAIGATKLVMGFLTLLENQVDQVQVIPGVNLIKVGKQQLDRTMTGVTYALSQQQNFFIIFDAMEFSLFSSLRYTWNSYPSYLFSPSFVANHMCPKLS